ncbi:MAG: hypothetical protein DRP78_02585 [Candidatus Omnitrophota bacterium]|nr:MAG: hypothetical protein DRP78_02585 [Candidatus Omnitrophota bacterium]
MGEMNFENINPFINATVNALGTMASVLPDHGEPFFIEDEMVLAPADISAVIGLAGDVEGWVAVCFSKNALLKIASNMLAEEKGFIDRDVQDVVGEIVNMVAGGSKCE